MPFRFPDLLRAAISHLAIRSMFRATRPKPNGKKSGNFSKRSCCSLIEIKWSEAQRSQRGGAATKREMDFSGRRRMTQGLNPNDGLMTEIQKVQGRTERRQCR